MRYVQYSVKELMEVKEDDFIKALYLHTEKTSSFEVRHRNKEKEDSWKDCRLFLQKYILQYGIEKIKEFSICFEYQIFDGTWIDAVIVCEDKLIILEFKSGVSCRNEILASHRTQIAGYYNKVTNCNRVIWEELKSNHKFKVEKYLVYTNALMKGKTGNYDYICVGDEFVNVISQLTVPATDKRVRKLLEFDEELDITMTGIMKDILQKNVLSKMYVQDDNVAASIELLDNLMRDTRGDTLNLVFVKGAPGTGKTGIAFSLLERYLSEGAKYVTGNGNLSKIFSQMLIDEKNLGVEKAIVGAIHDEYNVSSFCKRFYYNEDVSLDIIRNKLLIIDEAQRIWNPMQIAVSTKNKLNDREKEFIIKNEVSEAKLILRAVMKATLNDRLSRTLVFLLGTGQEIYVGEEDGEKYIKKAISYIKGLKLKRRIKIHLFVPTEEMVDSYSTLGDSCELKKGLLLKKNKRNVNNDISLQFVDELIEGKHNVSTEKISDTFYIYNSFETLKETIQPINNEAFSIGLVVNGFDTQAEWVNSKPNSYYILNGEKVKNIDNEGLKDFFINKSCNKLVSYASQFNCQGLELDYSIMVWGNMMLWRNGQWIFSNKKIGALHKYCEKVNALIKNNQELNSPFIKEEELRHTFIKNCYRVLLTRARIATHIYVSDPETYEHLRRCTGESFD